MTDEKKLFKGIELTAGEEITAETLENLSNNEGDDDESPIVRIMPLFVTQIQTFTNRIIGQVHFTGVDTASLFTNVIGTIANKYRPKYATTSSYTFATYEKSVSEIIIIPIIVCCKNDAGYGNFGMFGNSDFSGTVCVHFDYICE